MRPTFDLPDERPVPADLALSWHDETVVRIATIKTLWRGTTEALDMLRDLLAVLTRELRAALADEPCPVRCPVSWATWRDEVRDLHACRRKVRRNLSLAEAAVLEATQRSERIALIQDRLCGMTLNAIGRRRWEHELEALRQLEGETPPSALLETAA